MGKGCTLTLHCCCFQCCIFALAVHDRQRANGLGPEGGTSLATGLARNCGKLKELVVADNRLGPRVSTLVAATMRGGTSKCLRGFGFRALPPSTLRHQDGSTDFCGAAPPLEGRENARFPPSSRESWAKNSELDSDALGWPLSAGESCSGGVAVGSVGRPPRLERTPVLPLSASSPDGPETTESEVVLIVEKQDNGGVARVSTRSPLVAGTAAFEEELGRPQTAGTASG